MKRLWPIIAPSPALAAAYSLFLLRCAADDSNRVLKGNDAGVEVDGSGLRDATTFDSANGDATTSRDASPPDGSVNQLDARQGEDAALTDAAQAPDGETSDASAPDGEVSDASRVTDATSSEAGSSDAAHAAVDAAMFEGGPRTTWDWNGIVGTGQSLAVGGFGSTSQPLDLVVLSVTQPYANLQLHDSTPFDADAGQVPYSLFGGGIYSVVPLVEPIRGTEVGDVRSDFQYPSNIFGETPHSGMANGLTFLALARGEPGVVSLHSAVGWWGHGLSDINKSGSGRAYPASLMEARTFKSLADQTGKTFGYQAVVLTHGESDATNPDYESGLRDLWIDYNEDLSAITGQTQHIPLIASQQGSSPSIGAPLSSLATWRAGLDYKSGIICAGPKYQYAYVDGLHLDAPGYRRLGEKYAEILDAINHGIDWMPLQPLEATLSGADITVTFHVPTPPLEWDDTLPAPHTSARASGVSDNRQWAAGRGFEVANSSGPLTIGGVTIAGNSVIVHLPAAPLNDELVVRYAITQDATTGTAGGLGTGRMGLLRDSNDILGYDALDVDVNVTNGSNAVTGVTPEAFKGRTAREIVTHASLPPNTIIVARPDVNTAILSNPWPGATGAATIKLHNSLHNYAVHFQVPVR